MLPQFLTSRLRTRRRARWAVANGFRPDGDPGRSADTTVSWPFREHGDNPYLFEGEYRGRTARLYQHTFVTRAGDPEYPIRGIRARFAVAAVRHDAGDDFRFDLVRRGDLSAAELPPPLPVGEDWDFASFFSGHSDDPARAETLLTAKVTQWLVVDRRPHRMPLRMHRGWILTWFDERRPEQTPREQLSFLTAAAAEFGV